MNKQNLFQSVWNKFMPVILMKVKLALKKKETEFLVMDKLDFEKASMRKNSTYVFRLELREGRIMKSKDTSSVGLDFANALKASETVFPLIKDESILFNLNNKFVLSITPDYIVKEKDEEQKNKMLPESSIGDTTAVS